MSLRLFAAGLLLLIGSLVMADSTGSGAGSAMDLPKTISWQKLTLEEQLTQKISQQLTRILPERDFMLTISISLKPEPAKPTDAGTSSGTKAQLPLGKINIQQSLLQDEAKAETVFDRIDTVQANVLIDESYADAVSVLARKVITTGIGTLGVGKTQIQVEKAPLQTTQDLRNKKTKEAEEAAAKTAPEEQKIKPWGFYDWISELKIPAGILLATVVLSLAIVLMTREHSRLQRKKLELMEEAQIWAQHSSSGSPKSEEKSLESSDPLMIKLNTPSATPEITPPENVQDGFDLFKRLLAENPEKAAALIKRWILAPSKESTDALTVLPQKLEPEEMNQLLALLSAAERKGWKQHLLPRFGEPEYGSARQYIASQIVEDLIEPPIRIHPKLQSALAGLKLPLCVEIVEKDLRLGALLVNLLPSAQVIRLFALLSSETANALTLESLKLSDEDIAKQAGSLARELEDIGRDSGTNPFIERASELTRSVLPEKENSIYRALAEAGEFHTLKAAATRAFPSQLVLKLTPDALRLALDTVPIAQRAEMISSRDEKEQQILLECLGSPGSKLRELIDAEVQQITADPIRLRRRERNKDRMWKEFADNIRDLIRRNELVAEAAENVLEAWFRELIPAGLEGDVTRDMAA